MSAASWTRKPSSPRGSPTGACSRMALLIASATAMELEAALSLCEGAAGALPGPGTIERRTILGQETALLVTGVGPVNAALAAGAALASGTIAGVVLVGVAGTFDTSRAPIGSLALADSEIFPEYGLRTPEGVDPRGLKFPQHAGKGVEVWDTVALDPEGDAARIGAELPQCTAGPSVTVAGVTACSQTRERIVAQYAPLTENMEGFPWALAAMRAAVPFIELRGVSNEVGSRTGWNLQAALETLAAAVPRLIRPGRTLAKGT
ncbi:futalosine hydrolase [Oceanidesulfovibrio marinus]|uniref:Futalosine hydrolase n=2 Tax=Oceanidesulfovibrio marinus TaxID=370038 RepID=A0ABX6NFA2_9BACT|nr:futalosine hydrolase [Oceanidesulfovibrio marinus]